MPVCANCGQENPVGARFCLACGTPLAAPEPEPELEEERKVITALFTDIVGSTASAERMDPEDVRARLAPYYARVRSELEKHGGTVEKFIGDAVVALFGAPAAHEDDPKRAVRAALSINRAVEELNTRDEWLDIHVRTAIHTGEALVVLGASALRGEGMAAGDVMNTAARLQSAAPVDGIVVGEATHRATASDFEYREGEPLHAKGKAGPIPVWVLVGEREAPQRPSIRTPLIGRDEELTVLTDLWERATTDRRPHLVNVIGQPGIGKSRLVAALSEVVERTGALHSGRCLPYGEGITYWPISEIVKSVAGIRHDDDQQGVALKLGRLIESLGTTDADELRTIAAALANLLGEAVTPRGTYSAGEIGQAELHWGVRRLFELLALERPLMLVVEDLHWAEPTLLELLQSLLDSDASAPILVVGSARPEVKDGWPWATAADRRRSLVELAPLDEGASRALVAEIAGAGADDAQLRTLLRNAGGNPLFLEETVRMLADARADPASTTGSLAVPESLQALIGSRLDALPAQDKRIAQQASVAGEVFWAGAIAYMGRANDGQPAMAAAETNGRLSTSLATLERRDFVRAHEESTIAGDREYEFKHILIRDVAYDRVPKGRRAELHVRCADWIAAIPGPEDEFVEIVAYHLERACRLAAAIARSPIEPPVLEATVVLARAADKAQRREGWREAARFYERALEVLGDRYPERAVELRLPRALARLGSGEVRAAADELQAVADLAGGLDRLDLRGLALVILANIGHRRGRASDARRNATEARRLADVIGDQSLGVRAAYSLAGVQADFEGMPEAAVAELRAALRVAEEVDDRALRVEGYLRLGFLLFNVGDLAGAEDELGRCIALASELGSLRDEARATFLLGLAVYYRGELAEAERLNLQARDWLDRTAEPYFQTQNFRVLALYALTRGDAVEAERWLREAIAIAVEEGGRVMLEMYRYLVEALVRQGRVDEAATMLEFASRNIPDEDVAARAYFLIAQATLASARGDVAAIDTYQSGIRLLDELKLPLEAGEARMAYAATLRQFSRDREAGEQLALARETFQRFGATALVSRIDAASID